MPNVNETFWFVIQSPATNIPSKLLYKTAKDPEARYVRFAIS